MTELGKNAVRDAAYRDVEEFLDADPPALMIRQQRACLLGLLGHRDEAQAAFVELLAEDPTNFGVLNDFGMFLFATGLRKAAAVALREAVRWHPSDAIGLTNLASLELTEGDLAAARDYFERAVACDPANPKAREGLSLVLRRLGEEEKAISVRATVVRAPSRIAPLASRPAATKVLLVESVIGGNVFTHDFLNDRAFDVRQVFVEYLTDTVALPEHDVVWNAIGDAERCGHLLKAAPHVFARTPARVLNPPHAIVNTTREQIAKRLSSLEGVVVPRVLRVARSALTSGGGAKIVFQEGLRFPLLLRSPGFQTGEHFVRVESADDLARAAGSLPGKSLNLIEFLDVRGRDGKVRKYRAIVVQGRLYPLHLAIAEHWKVHYFTADMAQNAAHRAEDAAFVADMPGALGSIQVRALEAIARTLALDYGGIDFSLDAQGRVVVFEANATMIVPEPDDDERWNYRLAPVQRIYDAVRAMVLANDAPQPMLS